MSNTVDGKPNNVMLETNRLSRIIVLQKDKNSSIVFLSVSLIKPNIWIVLESFAWF